MQRKLSDLAVSDFAHSLGLLVRRMRAAAAAYELSMSESAVLARLAKHGAATIADLARAESMRPQSMGTTVSALEEMGLVERKPHPTDGRQMNIVLTAKGSATRTGAKNAKTTWLEQAISRLDKHEQAILFEAGAIIKRLVEGDGREPLERDVIVQKASAAR